MPWPAGVSPSPEHRAKIAASIAGRPQTEEWIEKRVAPLRGRPRPDIAAMNRITKPGNNYLREAPILGECVYCGALARERDHVVPGEHTRVIACRRCNASKGARTPLEWLAGGLYA